MQRQRLHLEHILRYALRKQNRLSDEGEIPLIVPPLNLQVSAVQE
jgi:hypothetical protein